MNENTMIQNQWDAAKVVLSEVYRDKSLPKETRQISNRQPNLTPEGIREKRKSKIQSQQKKKNYKYQKRNETETKNSQKSSMKLTSGSLKR